MLDDHGFEKYEENAFPIAYLLTFRTFGTWPHGDDRGSIQRSRDPRLKTERIEKNVPLKERMISTMKQSPVALNAFQRKFVSEAILEVCSYRNYLLRALNVRSNHVHAVVSKPIKPERIVNDLKVYATRRLRSIDEVPADKKVWSRGASTRYLWKPRHVEVAIDYVMFSQGDIPFETVFQID